MSAAIHLGTATTAILLSMAPAPGATQKEEGNQYFKAGQYAKAVGSYSAAIAADRSNITYILNRSQAYLKLEKFEDAARDASNALNLEPKNTKALFRRAAAYKGLTRFVEALNDLKKAKGLEEGNKQIESELQIVQDLLEQQVKTEQRKKAQRDATMSQRPTTQPRDDQQDQLKTSKLKAAMAPEIEQRPDGKQAEDLMKPVTTRRLDRTTSPPAVSSPSPADATGPQTQETVRSKPMSFAAAKEARAQRLAQSKPPRASTSSSASSRPEVTQTTPSAVSSTSKFAPDSMQPITTAYEFSKAWREAKSGSDETTLQSRCKTLERLKASDLPQILGNSLEPELLSDMIHCCYSLQDTSFAPQATELLSALPAVSRFDFISLLLDSQDRTKAQEVLKKGSAPDTTLRAWA